LVDVAQDVIVRQEDCKTKKGITIYKEDSQDTGQTMSQRLFGRVTLDGKIINRERAEEIEQSNVNEIKVRSAITCQTKKGVCKKCYGYDLGYNEIAKLGDAVGIISAQAIGEPGTQLTLRTFKAGGVAGASDITQGLPRVEEIFEARSPKGKAVMVQEDGEVIDISKDKNDNNIININEKKYKILKGYVLFVKKGDEVKKGQQLCEGSLDLKELFELTNKQETARYIINQIQNIYSSEGANIHDKHIEIVIRQMFSRVRVQNPGDTQLLPDDIVELNVFEKANALLKKNKKTAKAQQLLLGITKVALTAESWLSAASFQETARVLINAAIMGSEDKLQGLKENVIIGKLIPAGTGFQP